MAAATVRVKGLSELNRALKNIDRDLGKEVRDELKRAAEPVRKDAASLALAHIRHIGDRWSQMRIGATTRVVYVAPKQRRRSGSPRPRFGAMLLEEAMIPALEQNAAHIEHQLGNVIDTLAARNGF